MTDLKKKIKYWVSLPEGLNIPIPVRVSEPKDDKPKMVVFMGTLMPLDHVWALHMDLSDQEEPT